MELVLKFIGAALVGLIIALIDFYKLRLDILNHSYAGLYYLYLRAVPRDDDAYNIRTEHAQSKELIERISIGTYHYTKSTHILFIPICAVALIVSIYNKDVTLQLLSTCGASYIIGVLLSVLVYTKKNKYVRMASQNSIPENQLHDVACTISNHTFVEPLRDSLVPVFFCVFSAAAYFILK